MRAASIMVAPEDAALVKKLANYAMRHDSLMRLSAHFGVSVDIISSAGLGVGESPASSLSLKATHALCGECDDDVADAMALSEAEWVLAGEIEQFLKAVL